MEESKTTTATRVYGIDTLALPKYVDIVAENILEGWGFATFADTFASFSETIKAVETVLKTGKPSLFRVQLLWSDTHSFSDRDIPRIKQYSKAYETLLRKYPNCKLEISPMCEHNLMRPDEYLDIAQQSAPSATIVNTVYKGALSKKYKNEVHRDGNPKAPGGRFNFGYDGVSQFDADIVTDLTKYGKAESIWGWIPQCNGKRTLEKKDAVPRDERKHFLTKDEFISMCYQLKNWERKLAVNKELSLPAGAIYKSQSDRTTDSSSRSSKPVLILKERYSEVKFVSNGSTVGVAPYSGEWSDHDTGKTLGYLYRFPDFGYEMERLAKKANDKNTCTDVIANNKRIGRVCPAFRSGTFR